VRRHGCQGLRRRLGRLAPVGLDRSTGGYTRLAWTPEDRADRSWFVEQARRRSLTVRTDRNGNLWAWAGEPGPERSSRQPPRLRAGGGAFDGPLGVVAALGALDLLRQRGVRTARPVALVVWADEEGGRFGVACAGSRLLTGSLDPGHAAGLRDAEGIALGEAAAAAGVDPAGFGRDDVALDRIGVFVELHVEQGRALADLDAPIGVATAIWPHGRWRLRFTGASDHAGTTRLPDRRDPVLPFATTALAARAAAHEAGALATFGRVVVVPVPPTPSRRVSTPGWMRAHPRRPPCSGSSMKSSPLRSRRRGTTASRSSPGSSRGPPW
jgi:N-carbamoyl-L-amino-acid hydrolase